MKMPLQDSGELQQHSEAKVRLLRAYLRNYLAVIINAGWFASIDLYDLFCGPGRYGTASEGSPLAIMRVTESVISSLHSKDPRIPMINFHFADSDSDNIARADLECKKLHTPQTGTLEVVTRDYRASLNLILTTPENRKRKEFVFIDPTGYSDIKPVDIRNLLDRGAEILLFLPIQFMYRFQASGTPEPLQDFVGQLSGRNRLVTMTNAHDYALELKQLFREFLGNNSYASTFLIEKDASTLFGLFFFTTKWQGHFQWIEAKWNVGESDESGWSFRNVPGQTSLFGPDLYAEGIVIEALKQGPKNNCELFEHAVLGKELKVSLVTKACERLAAGGKIRTEAYNESPFRRGRFYIGPKYFKEKDVRVTISLV